MLRWESVKRTLNVAGPTFGALVALAVVTCDSPTSPRPEQSERIPVGTTVSGSLSGTDTLRVYSFPVVKDSEYVVFANVTSGGVSLILRDSGQAGLAGVERLAPNGQGLYNNLAFEFSPTSPGTWIVEAHNYPAGAATSFQLLAFQINRAPEIAPAHFAIGDTIQSETISPPGDIDAFVTGLDSGQDVVAVATAPADSGLAPIILSVGGPPGTVSPFPTSFPTGVAPLMTTGRLHASVTGTYTFTFQGSGTIPGVPPAPFRGPYRFWTWAVNPAPEHVQPTIQPGAVVTGERIDRTGDVDVFSFADTAGALISVFYLSAVTSHLEFGPAGGAVVASVQSDAVDTSIYARGTGRLTLPKTGTYTVRVSGDGPLLSDTGSYRFLVYPIDPRPERLAAAILPGDTVTGESIDVPGDVDEFTFTAAAGQDYYAFLQARSGSAQTHMQLDVVDSGNTLLGSAYSTGADTSLRLQMTPRISVATSRTLRLRIFAPDTSSGPYRVFLYAVNPKPESRPDTIAVGDSMSGESLNIPGDVDQFRVHVPTATNLNVIAQYQGFVGSNATVGMTVTDSASGTVVATAMVSSDSAFATGGIPVHAGTYLVRVAGQGFDGRPLAWGPYRLWVINVSNAPEATRDTIAIGDTVQGEKIDVPGDVDTYHFYGVQGQHLNFMLQGQVPPPDSGWFGLYVQPPGTPFAAMNVQSPSADTALSDHQTVRYDLPATGWYTVRLTGGRLLPVPVAPLGPYRFAVVSIDSLPETHAVSLALGDSVTNEAIDYLGDLDHFTVTATPGRLLYFLFGTDPNLPCCNYPNVVAFDPATGDTLTRQIGQFMRVTSPFVVPAAGTVTVDVSEYPHVLPQPPVTLECSDATCGGLYGFKGSYTLEAFVLDSLPEVASPTYVLGDTVSTEAIAPAGDVDQFTLTATPGDTLTEGFRLLASSTPPGGGIAMEVVDAATGMVITGGNAMLTGTTPGFATWGQFVVPPSGRLLIRFFGAGTIADGAAATAPYAFYIK